MSFIAATVRLGAARPGPANVKSAFLLPTGTAHALGHLHGKTLLGEYCRAGGHSFKRIHASSGVNGQARVVVLTREAGKNDELRQRLQALGLECLEVPMVETLPGVDRPRLSMAIRDPTLQWITVTSPEAAAVFLEGWEEAGRPPVRMAAVGGGTARILSTHQAQVEGEGPSAKIAAKCLAPSFLPSKAYGKALAEELPVIGSSPGRVLYPCSTQAGPEMVSDLAKRGFDVVRLNTYATATVKFVSPEIAKAAAEAHVATFASPSAVKAWTRLIAVLQEPPAGHTGLRRRPRRFACIGTTSADAVRAAGLVSADDCVFNPGNPGLDGWVMSIQDALAA